MGLGGGRGSLQAPSLLLLLQLLGLVHEEECLLQGHDHLLPCPLPRGAQACRRSWACCRKACMPSLL